MTGTTWLTPSGPGAAVSGREPCPTAAEWLPSLPAELFGLDPVDPPALPARDQAPLGVTAVIPTCPDPAANRQALLIDTLRPLAASARHSGLPLAVVVAADGLPPTRLAELERALAGLRCPAELLAVSQPAAAGVGGPAAGSAASTRNHALGYLASLPPRSPLRLRYLLFLDDDSRITPAGVAALVQVLEAHPAAIAACPAIVPVADLDSWRPPDPVRPAAVPLPGPWRGGWYDLLSVTSHGSSITGRVVGLLVRASPVLTWIAGGGRMFCPVTPRGSSEDMLAMASLAALGPLLSVPQAQVADLARATPAATRRQQLRWGYDHAWLARALAAVGLLDPGVRALTWDGRHGWQEVRADDGLAGVLVNPDQLGVLSGMLSAVAEKEETATAMAGADARELAAAAATLAATLRWWEETAADAVRRPRPDLPDRVPDDWADLRHGLDSQLAHVAGNALGSLHAARDPRGLPGLLLFGLRQRGHPGPACRDPGPACRDASEPPLARQAHDRRPT